MVYAIIRASEKSLLMFLHVDDDYFFGLDKGSPSTHSYSRSKSSYESCQLNIQQQFDYQLFKFKMLHELLFALLGVPGTLITKDSKGFSVNRSFNILKQSEMTLLNEIAQIGYNENLLNQFISNQTLLLDYSSQSRRVPSVYRKAFAFGLDNALKGYKDLIISIQDSFLKNKHFTIANIKAEVVKYQLLLPELVSLVNQINDQGVRGGNIIDLVFEKYLNSNFWFKETLHIVLKECYQVLINQISSWILYGEIIDKNGEFFIHRVSYEPTHKFKFTNSNIKQVEITDWEMYTIESNMIPKSFVKESTAGKILFIGKSIKILRNCEKLSNLPSEEFLTQVTKLSSTDFSSNSLEETVESIRHTIAQKMIHLIMEEQKFMKELVKVNDYYLMIKGDFYHLLLEKCKGIQRIPHKEKVQKNINFIYLPNTFQRLNISDDVDKIRFDLRPLGFSFNGFKSFNHLCPVGNIDLVEGKSIKFNSSDGALWHKTKQIVQNDFEIGFIFKFRKYSSFFKNQIRSMQRTPAKAMMSIVFQNYQQVSHNSHTNPSNLKFLQEFISIDFGFVSNEKQTQFSSVLQVVSYDAKKNSKPLSLGKKQIQTINLNDQNPYHMKISYKEDAKAKNFRVSIGVPNNPDSHKINELTLDLSLPYYLNLEMGRAHIGFISNLMKSNYCAEIDKWDMICTALNHYGDHWSDLCLSFKTSWPLDLVLTPDLLDNFLRVHKFLFPIRQTQIELEQMWVKIPRRIKEEYYSNAFEKNQINTFERRLSAFRTKISLIINQLWKYYQLDVIETTWIKLKAALEKTDDFQHFIKMVNKYIKSIQTMFFFNMPKIQRIIHQIVDSGKKFIIFFARVDGQKIDEDIISCLQEIKDEFDDLFKELVGHLRELAKINSSPHLYHFSQRMEACTYLQKNDFYRIP